MLGQIRHRLMDWIAAHWNSEDRTVGLLVAKSAELQEVTNNRGRRYRCHPFIAATVYAVLSMETLCNDVVDLSKHTCSRLAWETSGHPCGHAISIILNLKQDPHHYTEEYFTIAAYQKTYEQLLFPLDLTNINGDAIRLLNLINKSKLDEDADELVLPPVT